MKNLLLLFLIVVGAVVALIALDRLLLRMEAREWIYWRTRKPKGGGLAAGLTAMHELVEPEVRQVREERQQHAAIIDTKSAADRGDDPGNPDQSRDV